jgi:predicted negative regulator of RcsB-dependent stress response
MNALFAMLFQALFPVLLQGVTGLLQQAKDHADAGNHDAAHAALSQAAAVMQSAVTVLAPAIDAAAVAAITKQPVIAATLAQGQGTVAGVGWKPPVADTNPSAAKL